MIFIPAGVIKKSIMFSSKNKEKKKWFRRRKQKTGRKFRSWRTKLMTRKATTYMGRLTSMIKVFRCRQSLVLAMRRTKVDFGIKPLTRGMQAITEKFFLCEMLWNSNSIYYLSMRVEARHDHIYNGWWMSFAFFIAF